MAGFIDPGIEWYRSKGIVSTKPDDVRVEQIGKMLLTVDVRWPGFDRNGIEQLSERSYYIVQIGNDGVPRIRLGLTQTT